MHKNPITAFHSHNTVGASPALAQALLEAASGTQPPYGAATHYQCDLLRAIRCLVRKP